jgi:uncharacterized membrane protein YdjX (TVP38/TMEM64 family)
MATGTGAGGDRGGTRDAAERFAEKYLRLYATVAVGFLVLAALAASAVGTDLAAWARLAQRLREFGDRPWAPAALLAGYYLASLAAMPGLMLLALMVSCLGEAAGLGVAMAGTACSAATVHVVARRFGAERLERLYPDQMRQLRRLLVARSALRVLQMRLLPMLPFHVVNATCGVTAVPLFPFIAATVVGLSPKMLVQLYFVKTFLSGLTAAREIMLTNLAVSLTLFVLVTATGLAMERWLGMDRPEGGRRPPASASGPRTDGPPAAGPPPAP